jgi:B-cell receptor-associated protein 31
VFILLMAEMVLFMLLILPLPFTIKRRLFTYVSNLRIHKNGRIWEIFEGKS